MNIPLLRVVSSSIRRLTRRSAFLHPRFPPLKPYSHVPRRPAPCHTSPSWVYIRSGSKIHFETLQSRRLLEASLSSYTLLFAVSCCILAFGLVQNFPFEPSTIETKLENTAPALEGDPSNDQDSFYSDMPIPPGHLGSLTPEQEIKLRELWAVTLKTFGVEDPNQANGTTLDDGADTASETGIAPAIADEKRKKKRMSIFGKRRNPVEKEASIPSSGTSTPTRDPSKNTDPEDKYGQVKEFHEILATVSPETLRAAFWSMVKADHPDALLLRFLRARKWDVDRALVMLISTMRWRAAEMHVDDDVIKRGEGGALEDSKLTTNAAAKKEGEDFLAQLRLGKSFLHGTDKEGRPLCFVRTRLHRGGEQSEKAVERYTVYVIETARLVLRPPVETACIVFDMTHFTMANMDYAPVKFMIKIFEANYPESLGAVLVHKAPWIFQGIWNIIKGWLDPVVAKKVHFTRHVEDLQNYIPKSQIIKELGGDEDWEYQYIEPTKEENALMKEDAPRTKLEEERKGDVLEFEARTFDWIGTGTGAQDGMKKARDVLADRLKANYWALDPYIRARTLYDRVGMITNGGKINFYPDQPKQAKDTATTTTPAGTASGVVKLPAAVANGASSGTAPSET